MLQFIKRLFQKDNVDVVLPKQTIAFAKVQDWLDSHTSKSVTSVTEQTKPIVNNIDDAIFACQENLKKLENAQLKNKNISSRELSIMKGNRESYVRRTRQFLDRLASLYDKQHITYEDMKKFSSTYASEVDDLNKALFKPYAVLQHFFANESYSVAQHIKKIDKFMKQLAPLLEKESPEAIADCKKHIALIADKLAEQKKLAKEKEELEKDLAHVVVLEKQATEKLAKVEQSEGYAKYTQLVAEKESQEKKITDYVATLTHSFAVLDKGLRKFAKKHEQHHALIESYLTDPLVALQQDTSFAIVSVLEQMKTVLNDLDLKDDKKAKTQAELQTMLTDLHFYTFLEQYKKFLEEKHQTEKNIAGHFSLQAYKEATYMLTRYKEKVDSLKKNVEAINAALTTIDIKAMVVQLEKDLHQCTRFDVEIKM